MESKGLPARILTIAGSDSGGGAGIQADLKTIAALGGYGMSVVTALTAQNTLGVTGVHEAPPEFVGTQFEAVVSDIGVDAAKTGMLSNAEIIGVVAEHVRRFGVRLLVVDPVMVAKSGDPLLRLEARTALIQQLLPLAYVLTPNIPEAEALSGIAIGSEQSLRAAAADIHAKMRAGSDRACYLLLKGGHLEGPEAIDWLFDGELWRAYTAPRIRTENTHGTGCTFAAAITTLLGQGLDIGSAVGEAKVYLTGAIQQSLALGRGHGPLHHGWRQYPRG